MTFSNLALTFAPCPANVGRVEHGRAQLVSRNGHPFSSFTNLANDIGAVIPNTQSVLDGEIVCVDKKGRPQFRDMLFHRGDPCLFAFDLLFFDGKDWRRETLIDRKLQLRRLLSKVPADSRLKYVDHMDGPGTALSFGTCASLIWRVSSRKLKSGPYVSDRENSTWRKILNPNYSPAGGQGRTLRARPPHSCAVACAELEEVS